METSPGCLPSKQLCGKNQILHGDHPVGPGFHSEGGLDGLHGYERCLFPYSNSPVFKEIPEVHVQPKNFSVQGSLFRTNDSPASFHQGSGPPGENCPPGGFSNSVVPRRLVGDRQVKGGGAEGKRIRYDISSRAGHSNKLRKVLIGAHSGNKLLRNDYRYRPFLGFSDGETNRFRSSNLRKISCLRRSASQSLAEPLRAFVFPGEIHSRISSQDETSPVLPEQDLGQRIPINPDSCSTRFENLFGVVVKPSEINQGASTSKEEPRPEVILRCLKTGLGSHNRGLTPLGEVVSVRQKLSHKCPGIKSHLASPERGPPASPGKDSSSLRGQHDSSVIHNQTRRDAVMGTVQTSRTNILVVGETPNLPDSSIHQGSREHSSRHSKQERSDHPDRVDSSPRRVFTDLEVVGSPDGGPLRHQPDKEVAPLLLSTFGPHVDRNGRHVARLVQHGRLCLSPICHGEKGAEQIQTVEQLQDDSNCPVVATEGVVSGPSVPSVRTSKDSSSQAGPSFTAPSKGQTQKPPHASVSRLETMQGLAKHKDLSKIVSKAIFESRRPSTNNLYQRRWATYVAWCRSRKLSASRPTINSICEFLIFLFEEKKLAVDTIRCYRSTLHSVLRHTGIKINKNEDVKDVIRSLKLRAPIKNPRVVHWNLDVVLKFLTSDKFEPLNQSSLLNLTRKTFILLALALAKRISELQALSRSVGFCKEGALVSLAWDFRAKNDTKCKDLGRNFLIKELGSLVGQEEEALLCPVRALKAYLDRTKPLVGQNMSRLFVSPRKPTNAASKNALTCLTKDLIREAHERLQPELLPILKVRTHELRGVSTSVAFKKNLSLQSVMEAAQWRCHSVFASHYLKDVELKYEDCRTLGPLLVAGTVIT